MSEIPIPQTFPAIKFDAIVDIQISGAFLTRIHQLFLYHAQQKSVEDFAKVVQGLKTAAPDDVYSYHLETLLTMLNSIELAAKEQDKITQVDIPEDSESTPNDIKSE